MLLGKFGINFRHILPGPSKDPLEFSLEGLEVFPSCEDMAHIYD